MEASTLTLVKRYLSNIMLAIAAGIILFLVLFFYQRAASAWLLDQRQIVPLPAPQMPQLALPPVTPTPLPTSTPLPPTPTPTPTLTPEPQPPIRLSIPAIGVNHPIVEASLESVWWNGGSALRWQAPSFAVGHRESSARPGALGNMFLSGHNNTAGSVFRSLSTLAPGDEVIVYTADDAYHYRVESLEKVLWRGANEEQLARHFELGSDTPDERLTLLSCWPYATYTHRIYVIAKPVSE